MEAIGFLKNYDWGKKGHSSMIAQLSAANSSDFKIDPNTPYAELWMGTHTWGKAKLKSTGEDIADKLPYLFKILCMGKALSIQVHPDKEEAERLHSQRPHVYPDPNYKPELAIALSPFTAMVGFRPYNEIYRFLVEIPPLRKLLVKNEESIELLESGDADGLKSCYERIFTMEQKYIVECIDDISQNYWKVLCSYDLLEIFNRLNRDFPYDVGLLSLFFVNVLHLEPGQAIFLGPKEIHSYLSGDCIECMANSDNIIRAGLTPKFKDYGTLIAVANFAGRPKESKIYKPDHIDEYTKLYTPVKDYAVMEIKLPSSVPTYKIHINPEGTFLLVLGGERKMHIKGFDELSLKKGSIIYIPPDADTEFDLDCDNDNDTLFVAYLAEGNNDPKSDAEGNNDPKSDAEGNSDTEGLEKN